MNKIREKRQAMGITQIEFAEMMNVKQSSVSDWERGKTSPKFKRLSAMTQIFNCAIEDLVDSGTGTEKKYPVKRYHNQYCQTTGKNIIFNDIHDNHGVIGDVNGGTLRIQNGYDRPLSTQEQEILRIYNSSNAKTQVNIMNFMYEIEAQI